jgi:hypothetical protein
MHRRQFAGSCPAALGAQDIVVKDAISARTHDYAVSHLKKGEL